MESGAIRNSQIGASSVWSSRHRAHQARLHFKGGSGKVGGWSAKSKDLFQWLQIDLGSTMTVTHIATQGRRDKSQWVTQYKIQNRKEGLLAFVFYRIDGDTSAATVQNDLAT